MVLENRLWNVIGFVISESQPIFVHGKQILDGVLIVNEVVDDARKLKKNCYSLTCNIFLVMG